MRMNTLEATRSLGWRRLARGAAVLAAAVFAATAAILTDIEAGLFAVGLVIGAALLRWRRGTLGLLALGLLFADTVAWMIPGAVSNIAHGERFGSIAPPAALGIIALVGLVACVGGLLRRGDRAATAVAVIGIVLLVAGLVAGATASSSSDATTDAIPMDSKDVRFSPDHISSPSGHVEVDLTNKDLFWHTFTIKELRVNVRVPSLAQRRIAFRAKPGTYELVCAIPGHEQAGMTGTLTVT